MDWNTSSLVSQIGDSVVIDMETESASSQALVVVEDSNAARNQTPESLYDLAHDLALPESARSGNSAIDNLIDDCMVLLLARVPFMDQVTHVPLTCTRWKNLIRLVHQQRTSLVVWNETQINGQLVKESDQRQLCQMPPLTRYEEFLALLFNENNCHNLYSLQRDYLLRHTLDNPLCIKMTECFPNLKHLSFVKVRIHIDSLVALLGHFQDTLESLFLCPSAYFTSTDPNVQNDSIQALFAIINSMSSLRALAMGTYIYGELCQPNMTTALSVTLSQLEEFQLKNSDYDGDKYVYSILSQLNGDTLKRLSIAFSHWPEQLMMARLVDAKPPLRLNLTHLTLHGDHLGICTLSSYVSHLKQIVDNFPQLQYLSISTGISPGEALPLSDMLPLLCQLTKLTTLKLGYPYWLSLDDTLGDDCYLEQPSAYRIESLKAFAIESAYISMDHLHLLDSIFPSLRSFHLGEPHFKCNCFDGAILELLYMDPPPVCVCKSRLVEALNSPERQSKIAVTYTVSQ